VNVSSGLVSLLLVGAVLVLDADVAGCKKEGKILLLILLLVPLLLLVDDATVSTPLAVPAVPVPAVPTEPTVLLLIIELSSLISVENGNGNGTTKKLRRVKVTTRNTSIEVMSFLLRGVNNN
jgi:hypothetical protein